MRNIRQREISRQVLNLGGVPIRFLATCYSRMNDTIDIYDFKLKNHVFMIQVSEIPLIKQASVFINVPCFKMLLMGCFVQLSYIARSVSVDDVLLVMSLCGAVTYELAVVMASGHFISNYSNYTTGARFAVKPELHGDILSLMQRTMTH